MEHFNPILGHETTGQKFITCGEIMLRLTGEGDFYETRTGADRKSTRLNSSHPNPSRMPSSA